jgi:hypothetical protein
MPDINITIAQKIDIVFSPLNLDMIRGELNTKPVTISYTLGTGQTLPSGTILNYSTSGQPNFTQLTFTNGATFNGSGTVSAVLTATPGATVVDQPATFTIDGSTLTINLDYNSRPTVEDININIPFAGTKTFTVNDFTDALQGDYEDFDGDALAEVLVLGTLTGYFYPNPSTPLQANTWIPIANITAGQLTFKGSTLQTGGYTASNPYQVKDTHGNVSLNT